MPKPFRESDESRSRRRKARGNQTPADWATASPELVLNAITTVTLAGGAIRFGYTKAGGAYAIGFLGDGEPYTDYVRPSDDIDQYLTEVAALWAEEI